jgi:hypothetical protein
MNNSYRINVYRFGVFAVYGFQSDTIVLVVSINGRHIVYAGYTKKVHRVMNGSKIQKFIEL